MKPVQLKPAENFVQKIAFNGVTKLKLSLVFNGVTIPIETIKKYENQLNVDLDEAEIVLFVGHFNKNKIQFLENKMKNSHIKKIICHLKMNNMKQLYFSEHEFLNCSFNIVDETFTSDVIGNEEIEMALFNSQMLYLNKYFAVPIAEVKNE